MLELTEKAVKSLEKNGFEVHIFENAAKMGEFVIKSIPEGASVGFGGSMTVKALGIYDALSLRGNVLYDHANGKTPEEREALMRAEFSADVFIMSSNAVTSGGRLYNVDGRGNRVAALAGGPKTAYILLGENKFVETDGDAVERVRAVAAPRNAARLNKKTPCVKTGHCMDCSSPDRICNVALWCDRPYIGQTVHVCICPDTLGY